MLSRTADHLFWMARYTERAENTARMLDVNIQTSLMAQPAETTEQGWRAMLGISELQGLFDYKYDLLTPQDVLDFMVRDPSNPSSIASCLKEARENARAVRGTITTEAWEAINFTWLDMRQRLAAAELERDPSQLFDWIKYRSHLTRGVILGTMLKDESLDFIQLGTALERADNTARILDVKFHGAKQAEIAREQSGHEQQIDFYYWAAILRSVSAFEIYRKVYRDVITPARVAELLILHPRLPRSLLACMNEVMSNLQRISNFTSRDTERFAGRLKAQLQYGSIEEIMEEGLHNYLTNFLERIFELGNHISRAFLVPPPDTMMQSQMQN
jgi:uncharacterized alpha-E superfamily protein